MALEKDREDLERREAQLASFQRIAHLGYWTLDLTTGNVTWSDEIFRIFGVSPSDFGATYDAFLSAVHPEDVDRVRGAVDDAIAHGTTFDLEHQVLRPDGEIRVVHEHGEIERDASGTALHMRGVVHDISELRKAEKELQIVDRAVESATDAILITTRSGTIVRVNVAFERITGYSAQEVLGKNPRIMKSGEHDETFYKKMWAAMLGQGHWTGEIWDRRRDGQIYPKRLSIGAIRGADGETTHFVAFFSDITKAKRVEAEREHLARFDSLTGLLNRSSFRTLVARALVKQPDPPAFQAILFVDLDHFKNINDTLGHHVGDQLLIIAARRIEASLRDGDLVARQGGDEFTIALQGPIKPETTNRIATRLLAELSEPLNLEGHTIGISASIGIARAPDDGNDLGTLLKKADSAMYAAKAAGRAVYRRHNSSMHEHAMNRMEVEEGLRRALDRWELEVHYQPKLTLATCKASGVEALLRWRTPDGGLRLPSHFIPVAEESGLIIQMGAEVLRETAAQIKRWEREGLGRVSVAVNISARQFMDPSLFETITEALETHGVDAELFTIELTESMVMHDLDASRLLLTRLRDRGISLAIDDFGTGYSSLSVLKQLPIHTLKIDRSFIQDLTTNPDDAAIVQAILSMSKALGLRVVAEGVESAEQLSFLARYGCDEVQGFLLGRAVPADQVGRIFAEIERRAISCSDYQSEEP